MVNGVMGRPARSSSATRLSCSGCAKVFCAADMVSMISQDMTLLRGDLILCGISVGIGVMPSGSKVEVAINGIGKLRHRFA